VNICTLSVFLLPSPTFFCRFLSHFLADPIPLFSSLLLLNELMATRPFPPFPLVPLITFFACFTPPVASFFLFFVDVVYDTPERPLYLTFPFSRFPVFLKRARQFGFARCSDFSTWRLSPSFLYCAFWIRGKE